jgi:hypothetical protein
MGAGLPAGVGEPAAHWQVPYLVTGGHITLRRSG